LILAHHQSIDTKSFDDFIKELNKKQIFFFFFFFQKAEILKFKTTVNNDLNVNDTNRNKRNNNKNYNNKNFNNKIHNDYYCHSTDH